MTRRRADAQPRLRACTDQCAPRKATLKLLLPLRTPWTTAPATINQILTMTSPSDAPTAVSVATPHATEKLEELTKAASLQYSLKNFSEASDHYANAVEIQVNLNGEMAPENAELHFYYGRALYKVAIAKSDVLGSKVAQKEKKNPKTKSAQSGADVDSSVLANGATKDVQTTEDTTQGKPYFQLTGMENWSDSDEEGEDEEGAQEDAQDDFGDAYEIFEIARVLYEKQLEAIIANGDVKGGKGKAELTPEARAIKEKLADIHYYLVQISFENERFHDAIPDARAALALQEELNPVGHENVTEAHYSLSLALEFASIAKLRDQQAGRDSGASADEATDGEIIDWELRNEAIKHTHLAIQSLELRLEENQKKLSGQYLTSEQKKEAEAIIGDGKAMLEDLKTRVSSHISLSNVFTLTETSSRILKKTHPSNRSTQLMNLYSRVF